MARTLSLSNLLSRVVRNELTQNSPRPGFRIIRNEDPQSGNILTQTFSYVSSFFGSAIQFFGWYIAPYLPSINLSFTNLWTAIVQGTTFVYNFNWNITDQQIENQLQTTNLIISSLLGQQLGNTLGFLACGIVPASVIAVYNEPLGLYLLTEVGEEALEEFAGNLAALILISFRLAARNTFLSTYKNLRNMVKLFASDGNPQAQSIAKQFLGGNLQQVIQAWGEEGSRPWSFRIAVEEQLNNIENPGAQAFWENFYEETLDACVEAGYVLAGGLDTWIFQQGIQNNSQTAQATTVTVQPDRNSPEEFFVTYGTNEQVQNQIINGLNSHTQFYNRDVGQIIGEPLTETFRRPPFTVAVRVLLRSVPQPAWKESNGAIAKRVQVTIPTFNLAKLEWNDIKLAFGGVGGYLWGRFKFEVRLDNNAQILFYAASEEGGLELLNNFLTLTTGELETLNVVEEVNQGSRKKYPKTFKQTTKIYPAFMTIINHAKIANNQVGKQTTRGIYTNRRYLIPLYTESAPIEFQDIKQEILKTQQNAATVI